MAVVMDGEFWFAEVLAVDVCALVFFGLGAF